ncbi:phosphate ABC transporter substrate-binding/OmpA family protein [Pseudaestuariivita rosea]|uniref:phosphate ABC transporter substrate-binding/OmpA family protein n=1 Tax=Pseudaestuariivita rosea TaxID=2763263 RepID=UPI001ABA4860|nr:phosphate ABC transporter substrate-binding/OmpA family protein [Pseudaestuariivita rosea]
MEWTKVAAKAIGTAAVVSGLILSATAQADTVRLVSVQDGVDLSGRLLSYNNGFYVVETSAGQVTVNSAFVDCMGACPEKPQTDTSTTFSVAGSDTIGLELMPLLIKGLAAQEYQAVNDKRTNNGHVINLNVIDDQGSGDTAFNANITARGSSTGFRALLDKSAVLAMSSRPIKNSEAQLLRDAGAGDMRAASQEHAIAADGIVVAIHPNNPVDSLTEQQIGDLLTGKIANWSDVGGPNIPVKVYTRDPRSGTAATIQSTFFENGRYFSTNATLVEGNGEMAQAIFNDPGAIGYLGVGHKADTKPVAIKSVCGIATPADAFFIKTEEYPLQRRLFLYNRQETLPEPVKELVAFSSSNRASSAIEKAGFVSWTVSSRPQIDAAVNLQANILEMQSPAQLQLAADLYMDMRDWDRLSATFRFRSGTSILDNVSENKLLRLAEYIIGLPEGAQVRLVGFSDSDGAFDANKRLSEARALAVEEKLRQVMAGTNALDKVRVSTKGFGELSPVACNEDYKTKGLNRRVEAWVKLPG